MRVAVTGGAGFIGHHLVAALIAKGDEVSVIDNFLTGDPRRLTTLRSSMRLVEGDIRDGNALARAVEGSEVVFHLAALPSVQRSIADPGLTNDINVGGTILLMKACHAAGVRRVVVAGSSSVYGDQPTLPKRESQTPDPKSPYAASKLACEHYARILGALNGIEAVVLRYFNVFGPGQDPASPYAAVVPRFVAAALAGRPPHVNGDGSQSRDFTYVENVVEANLLAAEAPTAAGQVMNIGGGERYTLMELLDTISLALGRQLDPEFGPPLPGDVHDSMADISLARQHLGYEPRISFKTGVVRTVSALADAVVEPGP